MNKKTILIFDLDDTLYDRAEPFRKALEAASGLYIEGNVRAWYGIYSRHSQEMFEANARGEITLEESHVLRIRHAAAELGIHMTAEQELAYQRYYEQAQKDIVMSDTMKELLSFCCEAEIQMGILTNGPVKNQNRKVQALGLGKWIPHEHIFISEGIGFTKPDVGAFHYVEKALQARPEELCMIGDSYTSDIAGAMEAGWKTIWLDKNKTEMQNEGKKADLTVNTEEQLRKRIKGNG